MARKSKLSPKERQEVVLMLLRREEPARARAGPGVGAGAGRRRWPVPRRGGGPARTARPRRWPASARRSASRASPCCPTAWPRRTPRRIGPAVPSRSSASGRRPRVRCSIGLPCHLRASPGLWPLTRGTGGQGFRKMARQFRRDFELSALSNVAESGEGEASEGRQPVRRFSRRNPAANSEVSSSRRSSMDMWARSSRCMGAPRPACADASAGRAFAHNDLRFAAGELSGGDEPATPRVNSVLLHYLPPGNSKCPLRGFGEPKGVLRIVRIERRGHLAASARRSC